MGLTIYHNPRCSKSRQTLALIQAAGVSPEIVLYLDNPLGVSDIKSLQALLGFDDVRDMMRVGEAVYKEMGLKLEVNAETLIAAMAAHPKLIERPIVTDGTTAVMGRPPENVHSLLG